MKALFVLLSLTVSAQELRVYSEFARIDASGKVTAPTVPREILSPAIVRNGFTSFQIVVDAPKEKSWWLYVGQNPDDAVRVTLYRESGQSLEKMDQPVKGEGIGIVWMDVWCDREAPVRRIKIEPELNAGSDWVTYPMEARVMDAVVPEGDRRPVGLLWLQERYCAMHVDRSPLSRAAGDQRAAHSRNAAQDMLLAARMPTDSLVRLAGDCKIPDNPEWYLRIRDALFRIH